MDALVMAGMKFFFFTAACMALSFAFMTKTVLIKQGYFRYC